MAEEKKTAHPRGWSFDKLKKMDVKLWTYLEQYENEKEEIYEAIESVLTSGTLILGNFGKKFEEEFSHYCDSRYGIGVANGTDALFLGLKALNIGQGDEVITVANTAVPTVAAIVNTGAKATFVDIDPETYLMDVTKIEDAITEKTKCILPVHLYGQCVDIDKIKEIATKHNLKVLEDCAQAHGATYKGKKSGSMTDVAAFSFYPSKVFGAYGDAGMVVTNSRDVSEKVKSLRFYGMRDNYVSAETGYNSRLDELHAAILLKKLRHLEEYISNRRRIAQRYRELLGDLESKGLVLPKVAENNTHVYYVYVCRHPKRDIIIQELKKRSIVANISYEWPIHTMEGYKYLGYKEGDLPHTENACKEIFSLPMYPELTEDKIKKVSDALHEIFDNLD